MKHFIFSRLIGLGALAFLAGCGDEAKTSDYYKAHLEEAKARVAECKKMEKMNKAQQRDCSNANEAVLFQRDKNNTFYQSSPEAFEWK
ncbi:TPA: EexN family lipoprotein [Campylobacter coli]|nr:EexN family lipoprotein [Campylobacter coli]HEB9322870.1 EexN family lipoprotein [Campylobacter coli]HEB9336036.1 EexN family lipoprotein [Campylobacter coli]